MYDLQLYYKPGRELKIADTVSRAYLDEEIEQLVDRDLEVHQLTECLPISGEKLKEVGDEELQTLMAVVKSGWPKLVHK